MKKKGNPMKLKRRFAAAGGALALVAAGASVALIGGASSSEAAGSPSSAYGLEATGLIPVQATPTVTSTTGKLVKDSLVSLPSNPLLSGGLVDAQAQNGAAEADVTNLDVGGSLLGQLTGPLSTLTTQLKPACTALNSVSLTQVNNALSGLTGNLSSALNQVTGSTGIDLSAVGGLNLNNLLPAQLGGLCDALSGKVGLVHVGAITTRCTGKTGSVQVTGLRLLGLPSSIGTAPNSSVSIPGVLTVTLNKQTQNANGTFTVDGLYVDILGQQQLVVTSATCGNVRSASKPKPGPKSQAPVPHPIHTKAPVTG